MKRPLQTTGESSSINYQESGLKVQRLDRMVAAPNCPTIPATMPFLSLKKSRHVRFSTSPHGSSPAGTTHADITAQTLETVVPASEMTEEEKDSLWLPQTFFQTNIGLAKQQASRVALHRSHSEHQHIISSYSEALAATHASCTFGSSSFHPHEELVVSDHFAQHLALAEAQYLLAEGESTRGLEKLSSPVVGQDLVRRRQDTIDSVLLAQYALKCENRPHLVQDGRLLAAISEERSNVSRRYARAMGITDAMSALLEYGTPLI